MLLSKSYSPFFFHIHSEDQPVANTQDSSLFKIWSFSVQGGCEGQWIFSGHPTFALQDVVGQGEEGWHGAIQGWLQYSLGITQGCLHSSSIRHSPLWQILLHLCIPHFNIWLQRSPQEMSVRWHGILLRSWKREEGRWQLKASNYINKSQSTFTVHTFIWHCPCKNCNTKIY